MTPSCREEDMHEIGVIHGRFQVLHNDHLVYLLAGKARCRHLVVGVTNPDPLVTRDDAADPHRSGTAANPLTYFERYRMVRAALNEAGVTPAEFSVVPLPINVPELFRHYVPLDAVFFLTIYDRWGERKLELFESLGLTTEVLWRRVPANKGISAGEVRQRIAADRPWRHLVPPAVAELVEAFGLPARLQEILSP